MPYIPVHKRVKFDSSIVDLALKVGDRGDIAYIIHKFGVELLKTTDGKYVDRSHIKAGISDGLHEWSRRHMDEYEDTARIKNGDIL